MKIAVLMGSPRKKDSYNVCRSIQESLQSDHNIEFQYIFLKDYRVEDCKGCDICFKRSESLCPCKDDLQNIKQKLLEADGIILAAPVYAYQVPSPLKKVIDRFSYLFHRQELVGKPVITVVTTGGGGHKQVSSYLKMTLCGWGCNLIGGINIISPMFFESTDEKSAWGFNRKYYEANVKKIKRLSKRFINAIEDNRAHIPTFYDIFMFNCLRSKTFTSQADYDYWNKRGWLKSEYFYDVRLNLLKKVFGFSLKKLINFAGRKYKAGEF